MKLIDSHTHIHFDEFNNDRAAVMKRAEEAGVSKLITVGTDALTSAGAVTMSREYGGVWAAVGLHPHEAGLGHGALQEIARLARLDKVVAIGECGLDYYRHLSPADDQEKALRFQLELGLELGLPLVFHIRDAFDDFWSIFDDYQGARGVGGHPLRGEVHCFTGGMAEMNAAVDRGLYVALNGIMTFSKQEWQLDAARAVPLERLLLETDCPYLAPAPYRSQRNEPARLVDTAAFLAELRGESVEELAAATTANAERLFNI